MNQVDIYREIDTAEPTSRYRIAKELRDIHHELSHIIDKAMEVHIESDIESKNNQLRSLAWLEKARLKNSSRNKKMVVTLLEQKVLSLSSDNKKSGWIVYLKDGCVISVKFDHNYNTKSKMTIPLNEYMEISTPLRTLYAGNKINSQLATKRILKAIQNNKNKRNGISQ